MEQPPSPRRWFAIEYNLSRLYALRLKLRRTRHIPPSFAYVRS